MSEHVDCSSALEGSMTACGGVVYDVGGGNLRITVLLDGEVDGVYDPNPHDAAQELSLGAEHPTSTFTLCHASARRNNKTYVPLQVRQKNHRISWVHDGSISGTSLATSAFLSGTASNAAIAAAWTSVPVDSRPIVEAIIQTALAGVNVTHLFLNLTSVSVDRRRLQSTLEGFDVTNCTATTGLSHFDLEFVLPDTSEDDAYATYVRSIFEAIAQANSSAVDLSICTRVASSAALIDVPAGPQDASEFVHYSDVKIYTQHAPPSPPPPSPPPPWLPPPLPPSWPPPTPSAPPPRSPPVMPPADDWPPFITYATLDPNSSILLIAINEPVVAIDASDVHGKHFNVTLSYGAAKLLNWSRVAWPSSKTADGFAQRRGLSAVSRVALELALDTEASETGQDVSVAAAPFALADLAGNPMGPDVVPAGRFVGVPIVAVIPIFLLVLTGVLSFMISLLVLAALRWRTQPPADKYTLSTPPTSQVEPPTPSPAPPPLAVNPMFATSRMTTLHSRKSPAVGPSLPVQTPPTFRIPMLAVLFLRTRRDVRIAPVETPEAMLAAEPESEPEPELQSDFQSESEPDPNSHEADEPASLPTPTAADMDEVGRQAEAEVARLCKYVRLRMARRLIELLESVQFYGSKHAAGVDVFVEPKKAEHICKDVATALSICNNLLTEMRLAPLGLAVEGHTSASIHGHEESLNISTARAKQCKRSICAHLEDMVEGASDDEGSTMAWGKPVYTLVTHRGYGSTRPKPEFEDGGNHPENRRVEMRLLEPGDDGYCSSFAKVDGSHVKIQHKIKKKSVQKRSNLASTRSEADALAAEAAQMAAEAACMNEACNQKLACPARPRSHVRDPSAQKRKKLPNCQRQLKEPIGQPGNASYQMARIYDLDTYSQTSLRPVPLPPSKASSLPPPPPPPPRRPTVRQTPSTPPSSLSPAPSAVYSGYSTTPLSMPFHELSSSQSAAVPSRPAPTASPPTSMPGLLPATQPQRQPPLLPLMPSQPPPRRASSQLLPSHVPRRPPPSCTPSQSPHGSAQNKDNVNFVPSQIMQSDERAADHELLRAVHQLSQQVEMQGEVIETLLNADIANTQKQRPAALRRSVDALRVIQCFESAVADGPRRLAPILLDADHRSTSAAMIPSRVPGETRRTRRRIGGQASSDQDSG